jgi:hypothetical protein
MEGLTESPTFMQQRLSARRDNLPERCTCGAQGVVLGVCVDARRGRRIGVAEPLGDDGHRHAPKMQSGAARMPGVVQPDRAHPGRLDQLVPHPRERVGCVRLSRFVDRHVAAVGVRLPQRQPLLCITRRGALEDADQTLIKGQRAT